jgi:hypothetical protein
MAEGGYLLSLGPGGEFFNKSPSRGGGPVPTWLPFIHPNIPTF